MGAGRRTRAHWAHGRCEHDPCAAKRVSQRPHQPRPARPRHVRRHRASAQTVLSRTRKCRIPRGHPTWVKSTCFAATGATGNDAVAVVHVRAGRVRGLPRARFLPVHVSTASADMAVEMGHGAFFIAKNGEGWRRPTQVGWRDLFATDPEVVRCSLPLTCPGEGLDGAGAPHGDRLGPPPPQVTASGLNERGVTTTAGMNSTGSGSGPSLHILSLVDPARPSRGVRNERRTLGLIRARFSG